MRNVLNRRTSHETYYLSSLMKLTIFFKKFGASILIVKNVRKRNYGFKVRLTQSISKALAVHQKQDSLVPGR